MRTQKSEEEVKFEDWMAGKYHIKLKKKLQIYHTKKQSTKTRKSTQPKLSKRVKELDQTNSSNDTQSHHSFEQQN
jgi:transketolase